jgi:hypothetical protein
VERVRPSVGQSVDRFLDARDDDDDDDDDDRARRVGGRAPREEREAKRAAMINLFAAKVGGERRDACA